MTDEIFLVAHRGQPDSFPENSLEGFMHALQSGATYLETDIQVTADSVVVLSHNKDLIKYFKGVHGAEQHGYQQNGFHHREGYPFKGLPSAGAIYLGRFKW